MRSTKFRWFQVPLFFVACLMYGGLATASRRELPLAPYVAAPGLTMRLVRSHRHSKECLWVAETELSQGTATWLMPAFADRPLTALRESSGGLAPAEHMESIVGQELPEVGISRQDALLLANAASRMLGLEEVYDEQDVSLGKAVRRSGISGFHLPSSAEWIDFVGGEAILSLAAKISPCDVGNVLDQSVVTLIPAAPWLPQFSERYRALQCTDGFAGLSPVDAGWQTDSGLRGVIGNAVEWTDTMPRQEAGGQIGWPPRLLLAVSCGMSFLSDSHDGDSLCTQDMGSYRRVDTGVRLVLTPVGGHCPASPSAAP